MQNLFLLNSFCSQNGLSKRIRTRYRVATNHDIDDAIRAGVISDIPQEFKEVLGDTSSSRINAMIRDTIANSEGIPDIKMSDSMKATLGGLRKFMFDTVYLSEHALREKDKVKTIIWHLYHYYLPSFLELALVVVQVQYHPLHN